MLFLFRMMKEAVYELSAKALESFFVSYQAGT